jgi:hypothetical protein
MSDRVINLDEKEAEVVYDGLPVIINDLEESIQADPNNADFFRACLNTAQSLYLRLREFRFPPELPDEEEGTE